MCVLYISTGCLCGGMCLYLLHSCTVAQCASWPACSMARLAHQCSDCWEPLKEQKKEKKAALHLALRGRHRDRRRWWWWWSEGWRWGAQKEHPVLKQAKEGNWDNKQWRERRGWHVSTGGRRCMESAFHNKGCALTPHREVRNQMVWCWEIISRNNTTKLY